MSHVLFEGQRFPWSGAANAEGCRGCKCFANARWSAGRERASRPTRPASHLTCQLPARQTLLRGDMWRIDPCSCGASSGPDAYAAESGMLGHRVCDSQKALRF